MPNWNHNSVEIYAPKEAVLEWLVETKEDTFAFNMHKLFPEKFPASDPTGNTNWNYDWFLEKTGSKWPPEVYLSDAEVPDVTYINYDTAWSPNNLTLQRLYELTGWMIVNEYEEGGCGFE